MLDSIAVVLGVKKGYIVVGFIGAVLSLKFLPRIETWFAKVTTVLTGWACAIYLAPALSEAMDFKERTEYGITFLIGILGVSLMAALVTIVTSGDLWNAIKSKFSK